MDDDLDQKARSEGSLVGIVIGLVCSALLVLVAFEAWSLQVQGECPWM